MLRLSDSRNLGRTLPATGLVLGPLLFALDASIDPAWAERDAAYLAEVAGNEARYVTAEIASTIGALLMIVGMIGVMRMLRRRRMTFGQVAAGMVMLGFIGLAGSFAFSVLDLAMADFGDRQAMIELRGELQDSAAYKAFWLVFFSIGVLLGLILLAVVIYRRRVVQQWSAAGIAVAVLLLYLGGDEQLLNATAWLLVAAALAPLAARIWSPGGEARARGPASSEAHGPTIS